MSDYYVSGVIPSIGKRIAKFAFGSKFHKFVHDKENAEFHIFIKPGVSDAIVARFKEHWPGFKIFIVEAKEA